MKLLLAALLALTLGWVAFWWLDWLGRPYPVQGPDPYVVGLVC
jgi:hypothetical protein